MTCKAIAQALHVLLASVPSGLCSAGHRNQRGHSLFLVWQPSALFLFRNSSQNKVWIYDFKKIFLPTESILYKNCMSRLLLGRLGEKRH